MWLPFSISLESVHAVRPRAMRSSTTSGNSQLSFGDARLPSPRVLFPSSGLPCREGADLASRLHARHLVALSLLASYILMIFESSAYIISSYDAHAGLSR